MILNYNGKDYLEECLTSVLQTDYPRYEVILIDNASTDGSEEIAERFASKAPLLKVIRNKKNLGFAAGNNQGVRYAKGKYLVFLNNDTIVDPIWLLELVKVVHAKPEIAVAQSKLLMGDRCSFDSVGGDIDRLGIESFETAQVVGVTDRGQYDYVRDIFYARGAALLVRKEVFHLVGGFDSSFFFNYEEIDLCWRIRLAGYRIVFVPTSVVYHLGGRPIRRRKDTFALFHVRKNHIATLLKCYSCLNLLRYLPLYISMVIVHSLYLLSRGDYKQALASFRALFWVMKNVKGIFLKRLKIQRFRKLSDKEIMRYMKSFRIPFYLSW